MKISLSIKMLTTVFLSVASATVFAGTPQYAIYIDAGSSGSRLHIFHYENSSSMPSVTDVVPATIKSVKPGLSKSQPDVAGASLAPLLNAAMNADVLKGVDLKTVPVNVFGTAGMRLLSDAEQQAIYANVKAYIKNNSKFKVGEVKTIPGKMEGFYGWLDVNYLANNFQTKQPTVGSIDMGGASTEIAFEIHDRKAKSADDVVAVTINNQEYTVFSKSFLSLGMDQTRDLMTKDQAASACYPLDYPLSPTAGHYDFATCGYIYKNIIQQQHVIEQVLPNRGLSFIAYSGNYYTYHFFNVEQTPDQAVVEKAVNKTCMQSWKQIQDEHPGDAYAGTYCANAAYLDQLLYGTYGLQGYQLTVENKINQKDIDWTLGAALYSLVK